MLGFSFYQVEGAKLKVINSHWLVKNDLVGVDLPANVFSVWVFKSYPVCSCVNTGISYGSRPKLICQDPIQTKVGTPWYLMHMHLASLYPSLMKSTRCLGAMDDFIKPNKA